MAGGAIGILSFLLGQNFSTLLAQDEIQKCVGGYIGDPLVMRLRFWFLHLAIIIPVPVKLVVSPLKRSHNYSSPPCRLVICHQTLAITSNP
jgi:hypothetical protein